MRRDRRFYFILFVFILLLFWLPTSLRAQGTLSLSEAISSNQVEVKISGRSSTYFQPMVVMEVRNLTQQPLDIAFPSGSRLRNEQGSACDLVFLSTNPLSPIYLEASQGDAAPVIYRFFTYCLDPSQSFPSGEATYQPTGELVSANMRSVLSNIEQDNAQESFGAQIAIWRVETGKSLSELQERHGADYTLYTAQVERFLGISPLTPTIAPTATIEVTESAVAEEPPTEQVSLAEGEQATEQEEGSQPAPVEPPQTNSDLMRFALLVGGIVFAGLVFLGFMLRQPNRSLLAEPSLTPTPPQPPKLNEKRENSLPPKMRCVICKSPLDANRDCTNLACVTHVQKRASFVADEPTDPIPTDQPFEQNAYHERTGPIEVEEEFEAQENDLTLKFEVISGEQKGQEYTIPTSAQGLQGIIARGEAEQIMLPDDSKVSMPHAVLDVWHGSRGEDRIRDLGSQNGTWVNGEKLPGHGWRTLKNGDLLQFGSTKLRYDQSERQLIYENKPQHTISLIGSTNRWLITRQKIKFIHFESNDTTISVPHVYIRLHNGLLEVRDISSNKAVRILGKPLDGRTHIFDQDIIQIGRRTKIKVITDISGIPEKINQWRRQKLINHGGMADVYCVEHIESGEVAALKIPRPSKYRQNNEQGKKYRELFEQECKLTKLIRHANFVQEIESGQINGLDLPFLALKYIEGPSVYSIIEQKGKFSVGDAAEVVYQVALALRALHTEKYIHCDIKPSNIMIDYQGHVYLIDVGVATPIGERYTDLGVREYLPKEVLAGQPVDIDTDIYSLGQTLFKMLTRQALPVSQLPAHKDKQTGVERTDSFTDNNRPSTLLRQKVSSPEMQQIIAKCIRENRKERYQNIERLLDELDDLRYDANLKLLVDQTGWATITGF